MKNIYVKPGQSILNYRKKSTENAHGFVPHMHFNFLKYKALLIKDFFHPEIVSLFINFTFSSFLLPSKTLSKIFLNNNDNLLS